VGDRAVAAGPGSEGSQSAPGPLVGRKETR